MGHEIVFMFYKHIIITLFKRLNYIIILDVSRTYYNITIQVEFFLCIIYYISLPHYSHCDQLITLL